LAKDFSVGEIALRSGLSVSALHFYEKKGLIRSHRTAGNQRRYEREVLRRLAIIRLAGELGIPLSAIAHSMAALPDARVPNKEDWSALSARWRENLDRRIVLLTRLRDELLGCIGCGCLSMAKCPLMNTDDKLGKEGSGPRRLIRDGSDTYVSE
jgi:MerR family redox-sensitive transcriptional activator SoxR